MPHQARHGECEYCWQEATVKYKAGIEGLVCKTCAEEVLAINRHIEERWEQFLWPDVMKDYNYFTAMGY